MKVASRNLRLIRRTEISRETSIMISVLGVFMAFAVAGVLFLLVGVNPIAAYGAILDSFTNPILLGNTIQRASPLLFAALGLTVVFRLNFWNVGAEGQIVMGGIAATGIVTLHLVSGAIPDLLVLPTMFLASFFLGALYALVPALLKAKLQVNEILSTLMLNYIAILLGNYLVFGPWLDPAAHGFPNSRIFPPEAVIPAIPVIGGSTGFLVGIVAAVGIYFLMKRTTFGFELKVTGDSTKAAKYAGMSYTRIVSLAMAISGGLAGLGGLVLVSGIIGRMKEDFSAGYGYTSIIVAWLAGLNPLATVVAAFLFGGLLVSGTTLQVRLGLSSSTTNIFEALILIFVLASEFLKKYRVVMGGGL